MYSKFGQFIDGKWQEAEKKETYDVINPATEEVIGKASKASSADVQKALKSAEKGLKVWSNTTPWQRSYVIRKIADLMREKKDVLAKWLTLEVGKPLAEGVGEVGGGADIFEWNAEETKRIYGQTVQSRFPEICFEQFDHKFFLFLQHSIQIYQLLHQLPQLLQQEVYQLQVLTI